MDMSPNSTQEETQPLGARHQLLDDNSTKDQPLTWAKLISVKEELTLRNYLRIAKRYKVLCEQVFEIQTDIHVQMNWNSNVNKTKRMSL